MLIDVCAQIFRTLWAHKVALVSHHVRHRLGRRFPAPARRLGEGFRSGNKRDLSEFGENIMMIFPARAPVVPGSMNSARYYRLTYSDYLDVRRKLPMSATARPF